MVTVRRLCLALAACAALVPATAQADTLTCQVSASGSFSPGMQLVGGSGLYAFDSPSGLANSTTCSYDGGPRVESRITSEGDFTTTMCGFAALRSPSATTTGATIDVGMDGVVEVSSMRYSADVRSFVATTRVTTVNGRPETGGDTDGALVFRPQHPCGFAPLIRYTVDGVLALSW